MSDWIALGNGLDNLRRRTEDAAVWQPTPLIRSPSIAGLDVVCMADVKPTAIEWLWLNWVAIGKVSVLAGEGGRGKSTILCDLAARTTASDRWPDGAAASPAGGVIFLAAEDDLGDTLAPRLRAAGADMRASLSFVPFVTRNRRGAASIFRLIWSDWKLRSGSGTISD